MIRSILFLFFSAFMIDGLAQQTQYYPTDPEEFTDEIMSNLKRGGCDHCKATAEAFEGLLEANTFDSLQLTEIRNNAEQMRQLQMQTVPGVADYFQALVTTHQQSFSQAQKDDWHNQVSKVIHEQNFNTSQIRDFLNFSTRYFRDSVISYSASRRWFIKEIQPDFTLGDGTFSIDFSNITFTGATEEDTLNILNTSGTYFPLDGKWEGTKGKITWANAGFNPNKVYSTFEEYTLALGDNEFVIEPATLYYAEKFNEPVEGKLTYKLMISKPSDGTDYPMFETYDNTLKVENIMEGVQYIGGFTIKGREIQGSGTNENPAKLLFFDKNQHQVAEARGTRFLISPEEALSQQAEFFLFFERDTIYHPGVDLRYVAGERFLIASQGESGIGKAPFVNTHHNIEMDVRRITWDFDHNKIHMINKKPMSTNNPPAYFKSQEFFNKTEFEEYQGQLSYNPISSVSQAMRQLGTKEIDARNLVPFFNHNLSVSQIEPLLFKMVEDGFIYYNPNTRVVTVREKARKYVLANAKKVDFDYVSIKSESDSMNALLNLTSNLLNIYGVYGVTLSSKHFVHFFPVDKKVEMSENRHMSFDGSLFAGNVDYFGEDFYFDYDRFAIELRDVDSMVINVPTGEVDEYGDPILEPLKSVLSGLTGTLYIDAPINKSGYLNIPGYPKFDNSTTAYAYYDKKDKFKDVYLPDSFHFAIDTFSIDSLGEFDFSNQQFSGTLNSAGIFPEIKEELSIMDDGSLGFHNTAPDTGYEMYEGLGQYDGRIKLSNDGLEGAGKISYLTATVQASDFLFKPNATESGNAKLSMTREHHQGVEFPTVNADSLAMNWKPHQDSMILHQEESKIELFDDFAQHKGSVVLTKSGMEGSGTTTFGNTLVSSDDIDYGGFSMASDTALFRIKSDDEGRDLFNLKNAKVDLNFDNGLGQIESNLDKPTVLSFNLYKTTVNRFEWDMNDSIIYFKPDKEKEFSIFTSRHNKQDSLAFKATGGSYDLNTLNIKATGVPYIAVADVHVRPENGLVEISESANMEELNNAVVLMDSLNQQFRLYDADIKISGKKDLKGSGKYDYVNRSGNAQSIDFPVISTYHRSNEDTLYTHAEGIVYDTMDFYLDPQIKFRGDVHMHSKQKQLRFDGVGQLKLPNDATVRSGWFRINDPVDPKDVTISAYGPVNYDEDTLFTGIHLRYDNTNLYGTLMGRKKNYLDYTVINVAGMLKYDAAEDAYVIADSAMLSGRQQFGDLFRYENKTGNIHAEGHTQLGLDFDLIGLDGYGTIDKVRNDTFFRFDQMVALDFYLSDEVSKEIKNDMVSQTYQSGAIDYFADEFRRYFGQFIGDQQQLDDIYVELNKTGVLELPKKFEAPRFLFTDMKFKWEEETMSYMGKGTCGVAMVDGENVGKKMEYYVEFGFRRGNDYVNLYLKAPTDEWYYFSYENKTLHMLTSNFKINNMVTNTKMKNRKQKTDAGTMLFTISSEYRQQKFVQKMKHYMGQL